MTAPHRSSAHSRGSATSAHADAARSATPPEATSRPTYSGLRDQANGPRSITVVVSPPGSSAVWCLAINSSAQPFHTAKAARSSHPSPAVAGEASKGSPTHAETRIPSTRGPPTATGGHIRNLFGGRGEERAGG